MAYEVETRRLIHGVLLAALGGCSLGVIVLGLSVVLTPQLTGVFTLADAEAGRARQASVLFASASGIGIGLFSQRIVRRYLRTRLQMPKLFTVADRLLVVLVCAMFFPILIAWLMGLGLSVDLTRIVDIPAAMSVMVLSAVLTAIADRHLRPEDEPVREASGDKRSPRLIYPDEAISSEKQDELNRSSLLNTLESALDELREAPAPFVIAVNGEWGTGKTSILRMLQGRLRNDTRYMVAWFDPWQFETPLALLSDFFQSINAAVSKLYLLPDLRKLFRAYLSTLSPTISRFGISIDFLSKPEAENLRAALDSLSSRLRPHIIVMMDDLDRLERRELLLVLQLIRVTARFQNVTYIIALDRKRVEDQILGAEYKGHLDKFIDLDLSVGVLAQEDVNAFFLGELRQSVGRITSPRLRGKDQVEEAYRRVGWRAVSSLRDAKRILGSFSFAMEQLSGEVNVVDVLLLEMVRRMSLTAWLGVMDRPEYFVYTLERALANPGWEESRRKYYETLYEAGGDKRNVLKALIEEVFPDAKEREVKHREASLESQRDQRACNRRYFWRYFMIRVVGNVLPDTVLEEFVTRLPSLQDDAVVEKLVDIRKRSGGSLLQLFDRLITQVDEIDESKTLTLALAISKLSDSYRYGAALESGERERALDLIFSLAKREQETPEVQRFLEAVIRHSKSLVFAADVVWFSQPRANRILSEYQHVNSPELQRIFDEKASAELLGTGRDILAEETDHWWRRITNTWSNMAEKTEYLRQLAERNPSRIGEVVESFRDHMPFSDAGGPVNIEKLSSEWDIAVLMSLVQQYGASAAATDSARDALQQLAQYHESLRHQNDQELDSSGS